MTEVSSPLHRAKLFKYAKWALLALTLAYLFQFVRGAFYKGQDPMGAAFETIAHETFRKQYDGLPQMRVNGAGASPTQCTWWNFEQIWGRCVAIGIQVRDYQPEYLSIVEREVIKLAEQLRRPCALLPTLGLPNERQIAKDMECDGFRFKKSFRLRVVVNSVTVIRDQGPPSKPYRWHATNFNYLNSYLFKGEF